MTGYQKLKKENEILWRELTGVLENLGYMNNERAEGLQDFVDKQIAWIEKKIKDETK